MVRRDCIAAFRQRDSGGWEVQLQDDRWLPVGRTYLADARAMVEGESGNCR
jgi:hypothetical protein